MTPADALRDFLLLWFCLLAAVIAYRLVTGAISLEGLLATHISKKKGESTFSPARLQLLVATMGGLVAYAGASLAAHKMAPVSDHLVALFAASHLGYIGAKAHHRHGGKR